MCIGITVEAGRGLDIKTKAASLSVASNTTLFLMKLGVGIFTGSISVISEAAHSALDLFAAIIAFLSVRAAGRPADTEHPFGHGKIENISGVVEAILILLAAAWIIYESTDRIMNLGSHVIQMPLAGVGVMGLSALFNTLVARHLFKIARQTDSIALETDAYHLSTDVWTSLGVFGALIVVQFTKLQIIDPVVAIGVAALIMRVAFSLTAKASGPLMDVRLPIDEVSELKRIVMSSPQIVGFHKLRTRKSGPYRQIDYHLIVPADMPVLEAHAIAEQIENRMRERFPDITIVTHIEPDTQSEISEPGTELRHPQTPHQRRRVRRRRRF